MKSRSPRSFFITWLAFALAIAPWFQAVSFAQAPEPAKENPPEPTEPPVAESSVARPTVQVRAESADITQQPESAAATADSASDDKSTLSEPEGQPATPVAPSEPEVKKHRPLRTISVNSRRHDSDGAGVVIFGDSTLGVDSEADRVISILGSSTSAGKVHEAVVSVLGSSTSSGEVGEAVVSVLGNTRVTGGSVGEAVVSVLGSTYVNGHVRGVVVSVLGRVELGPDAVVDGDVVCVGGQVVRDPKSILHGHIQNVALGELDFAFDGLTAWVAKCLLYGRPLAFGAHLMWAWWIALAYLAVYTFVALVAPRAVIKCVQTLEERPGKSILAALLAMLLTPVVYLLLAFTVFIVIGVALIPLFTLGLFLAGIFGKVVMLAWFGRRIIRVFDAKAETHAALTVLCGGAVVLLLYTVPALGFVVYKLTGILGLGVVIYTLLLSVKSGRPVAVRPLAPPTSVAVPPVVVPELAANPPSFTQLPPVISAATLPRAGFWIRIAAALLDVIMVGVLFGMLDGVFGWFLKITGSFPLWFGIYNVVMWATKGTTIGGIICGLKVVRLDDRPVDWGMAIVRGLSAFLSFVVAGLGFIWVAFDDERQSWHDKIAGTTIVHVPKGTSLL